MNFNICIFYKNLGFTTPARLSPVGNRAIFWSCAECISQKKRLGGLLILLPRFLGSDGPKNDDIKCPHNGEGMIKDLLVELERLLIHSTIPVSEMKITSGESSSFHQTF